MKHLFTYYTFLFLCCLFLTLDVKGQSSIIEDISKIENILKENPKDLLALREICFLYLNKADYQSAYQYGKYLEKLTKDNTDNEEDYIFSQIILGQANLMLHKHDDAYNYLMEAEQKAILLKKDTALCSVYNGLGLYALNVENDHYHALSYFFKGLETANKLSYERLTSLLLANISTLYYLKNDTTGYKYAQQCYELGHKRNDVFLMYIGSLCNAAMLNLKKEYKDALAYIQEADFINQRNKFHNEVNIYNLYGSIFTALKQYSKAEEYLKKALEKYTENNSDFNAESFIYLANLEIQRKNFRKAEEWLEKGLEYLNKENISLQKEHIYYTFSECYQEAGDYNTALKFFKKYHYYNDSIYNSEKEALISRLRIQYETLRLEDQVKSITWEKEKQKTAIYWMSSLLFIFILFIIISTCLYYKKNKLYKSIVLQNQEAIRREESLKNQLKKTKKEYTKLKDEESQTSMHAENAEDEHNNKYVGSSLSNEKSCNLFKRLENLMTDEQIYKDPLLTKEKTADMLGTNRTYLSQVINEQTNKNFTQYINEYRIYEAVRILSDPQNTQPLKTLSVELGFNSMTTFYKLFQQQTGMTPAQYRKQVNELEKQS